MAISPELRASNAFDGKRLCGKPRTELAPKPVDRKCAGFARVSSVKRV